MFGLLKKKISDFVGKLTKKEEEAPIKEVGKKPLAPEKIIESKAADFEKEIIEGETKPEVKPVVLQKKTEPEKKELRKEIDTKTKAKPSIFKQKIETTEKKINEIELEKIEPEKQGIEIGGKTREESIEAKKESEFEKEAEIKPGKKGFFDKLKGLVSSPKKSMGEREKQEIKETKEEIETEEKELESGLEEIKKDIEREKKFEEEKIESRKEHKVKLGVFDQLKSAVTGKVVIKKEDISELLEEFELGLLEGDVALEIASEIKESLEKRLIGREIPKGKLTEEITLEMREILSGIMRQEKEIDLVQFVKSNERPVKIMFLGINGAGKTTTLAKIAYMLQKNGLKVVFAACDTFRAAAIEQLGVHGERLGVKVIKRPYGSDSSAVAYDAINHAKAHGIDAVLIDTAGRQDNNVDLINELKKMDRVIKPDLKVYIGESIGGNAVIEQVSSFNREIGLTGVILTKIDCDPKGGTIISISKSTSLPILYITNGQGYEDIEKFDSKKIIDNLLN